MAVNDIVMSAAGASGPATYIEDVFSTWLYTGTGATQTITNGIDLSGKGGLVWIKNRTQAVGHALYNTIKGGDRRLFSNMADEEQVTTPPDDTLIFNSNGFSAGAGSTGTNNIPYVSWTFREQPKFFDVVTYTGTGTNTTIAHNLGSIPGCIIVKRTDTIADWQVYHRSLANTQYAVLNSTAAAVTGATRWNSTTPTSSVFSLGTDATVNALGGTYVAYIYAHDAGGFGTTGTDNVISCGSYTGTGVANLSVTLGYEPQYLMIKRTSSATSGNWVIVDNMRSFSMTGQSFLYANLLSAEVASSNHIVPTATGFTIEGDGVLFNASGSTYIYIAIRRPMKTPTTGIEVFSPITSAISSGKLTTGFPVDLQWVTARTYASGTYDIDRLRGVSTNTSASARVLSTQTSGVEIANTDAALGWDNTGYQVPIQWAGYSTIYWNFKRAPGFFDVACYTGTGAIRTVNHNLGVAPELMIVKPRSNIGLWYVYASALGNTKSAQLNLTDAATTVAIIWNNTSPTSTVFTVGTSTAVNGNNQTFVAYLFATVAGVSKVGSYTGNGTSQTINCSFTTGARFIMIKRTDSTGDWYVWDSARGIVAGNDPHSSLNVAAAEVTTDDSVDADSSGFIVNQLAATNINVNAASYIFLAIA